MTKELYNIIKNLDRYKNFLFLINPIPFNKLFKDKDFDCVQLHSTQIFGEKDIVGFCGSFLWKDNKLKPLDGDSYLEDVEVIGYDFFSYNENEMIKRGIDILAGNNW